MKSTEQLKRYILKELSEKIPEASQTEIFFSRFHGREDGMYLFLEDGIIHFTEVERGKTICEVESKDCREVLRRVVDNLAFRVALSYAKENRKNEDLRRPLFRKEVELHARFGEDFKREKERQIRNTLKKYPFHDTF